MERKKVLAIGNSNFDVQTSEECYYVDKTLLIKDILDTKKGVTLITRPRRFGKTLNMDMLKSFFEYNGNLMHDNQSRRHLFNGLKIEQAGERYLKHFGQYPVISLSFKDAKTASWRDSYDTIKECIYNEYKRHQYIADCKKFNNNQKKKFDRFLNGEARSVDFQNSIRFLSDCLHDYYGKEVVILIDEYDVPLASAFTGDYYAKMLPLIRSLMTSALKDSKSLAFAVITGCLRISKESIFTGLNNLTIVSIASSQYSEHFGFTQDEVDAMLDYYGLTAKREEMQYWYDGYLFGNTEVYNPWSVINRVDELIREPNKYPTTPWANSSGNDIIHKLIERVNIDGAQEELETLLAGGTIKKVINENVTYDDAFKTVDNLWNFLFFTGYLKKVGEEYIDNRLLFTLKIPNKEVWCIYRDQISEWFKGEVVTDETTKQMIEAMKSGDAEGFQKHLSITLASSISYYDTAENFYHGFLIGLLSTAKSRYQVKSNRETGNGRSDIFLSPRTGIVSELPVIIIETKIAGSSNELKNKSAEALKQIETARYADEFIADGYTKILKYGIAFYKKRCLIANQSAAAL